jgi:NitT/TauT family transport system substrate-binding protein
MALGAEKVSIALNWVPEPEFGGIYAARESGAFAKHDLDVDIKPGGAGAPTWQQVASGKVEFGVASADEVVIARANGADIVAFFTIYQICPQGIMVHESRGLKSIGDVFSNPGTLAMEVGLPYGKFLQKKFGFDKIKRIPYDGGIGNFLADKNFSQQCFVFSEPLIARKQGSDPQTFLISDAGYNPYTGVVIVSGDYARKNTKVVSEMAEALRDGWRAYLDDPKPANAVMGKINKTMDQETFAAVAEAQKPLVETDETKKNGLGTMTTDRWEELVKQLIDIGVVDGSKAPAAMNCFVQPEKQ